jgi:hypothetical protein
MSKTNGASQPLDRLRKNKRPSSVRVGIVMDSRYQERVDHAQYKINILQFQAGMTRGTEPNPQMAADMEDAQAELRAAQAEALEHTEWFVAKALAPRQYDALMAKHPPTADQQREARKENRVAQYDSDTFPPALVAACVSLVTRLDEPDADTGELEHHELLGEAFVKEMIEGGGDGSPAQWNQGEIGALFNAGVTANQAQPQRVEALGNG